MQNTYKPGARQRWWQKNAPIQLTAGLRLT